MSKKRDQDIFNLISNKIPKFTYYAADKSGCVYGYIDKPRHHHCLPFWEAVSIYTIIGKVDPFKGTGWCSHIYGSDFKKISV